MGSNSCDVLVVGGGPAGLAAAIALRQRGVDVLVAEALHPPIDKACGEGLMPDSRRELARLGIELAASDGAGFHGIHFADRTSRDTGCVTAEFASGTGLGVRRVRLHSAMTERAESLGVQLAWGTHVLLREDGQVLLNGEPCRYRYLVGADGQASLVRRWAGLGKGTLLSRRFGFRRHFRVQRWSEHVEVHWGELGQAYITPIGEGEICVATIARDPHAQVEQVLNSIPYLAEKLRTAECTSRERGAATTTLRLRRVVAGNVVLVGDASGSADAITGEGMAMVFRQALLLAEAVERGALKHYAAGHPDILRLPQTMARVMLMMDRWPAFRHRALRVLAAEPQLFGRMVAVHIGEEPLRHFLEKQGFELGWRMLAPSTANV